MSPWFRRRRSESGPEREVATGREPGSELEVVTGGEPGREPAAVERMPAPEPATPDPAGPLSSERLDGALERLRREIPASSGEAPQAPPE